MYGNILEFRCFVNLWVNVMMIGKVKKNGIFKMYYVKFGIVIGAFVFLQIWDTDKLNLVSLLSFVA